MSEVDKNNVDGVRWTEIARNGVDVQVIPYCHDEAIDAIIAASRVTVLSYQEAIEGYLKLRGIPCS